MEATTFNFLEKVTAIVENNISNSGFTTTELSQQVFLSRSQLHRRLIQLTGKNTSEFIRETRLEKATKLLKNGDHNVSQVAYATGFSHLSWFAKCFKEKYGQSPSDYKLNH